MSHTRAMFKPYPAIRYKKGETPKRVENAEEDEALLSVGWEKTPKSAVIADSLDIHQGDENSMNVIGKLVDHVAAVVNMITRIDKVRSKKDLYWLANEIGLELEPNLGLKSLRKAILEGAKQHDELQAAIAEAKANEHS